MADKGTAQSVSLQATGPPPPTMQKINFDILTSDGKVDPTKIVQPPQTFLQRYVSISLMIIIILYQYIILVVIV
jgi:hypothetical protein